MSQRLPQSRDRQQYGDYDAHIATYSQSNNYDYLMNSTYHFDNQFQHTSDMHRNFQPPATVSPRDVYSQAHQSYYPADEFRRSSSSSGSNSAEQALYVATPSRNPRHAPASRNSSDDEASNLAQNAAITTLDQSNYDNLLSKLRACYGEQVGQKRYLQELIGKSSDLARVEQDPALRVCISEFQAKNREVERLEKQVTSFAQAMAGRSSTAKVGGRLLKLLPGNIEKLKREVGLEEEDRDSGLNAPIEYEMRPSTKSKRIFCPYEDCVDEKGKRKSVSRKADLPRHLKTVHGKPSIDCRYCDRGKCDRKGEKGFCRQDHYDEHLRKVHMESK